MGLAADGVDDEPPTREIVMKGRAPTATNRSIRVLGSVPITRFGVCAFSFVPLAPLVAGSLQDLVEPLPIEPTERYPSGRSRFGRRRD